jgi:hypothetical protein
MTNEINHRPPTYVELADLVCELVETNIANLDGQWPFVSCFTYSGGDAPDHWHRALNIREALIASKLVTRQRRTANPSLIRSLRTKGNVKAKVARGRAHKGRRTA